MKLTMTKAVLARELNLANEVIDRKNTIPILAYTLMDATTADVSIATTNLTEWLRASIAAEIERPGRVVLPVDLMHRLIGGFSDGPITIDVSKDAVKVTSGQSVTKFPTLPPEDFPMPPLSNDTLTTLPAGQLRSVFRQVRHAVRADGRYWLEGAHVVVAEGRFKGAATDGHRISEAFVSIEGKADEMEMILPSKGIDCLVKMLGIEDEDAPVHIGLGERFSSWSVGSRVLFARVLDGQFPKYQRMISSKASSVIRLDSEPLRQALRRLLVVVTKDHCKVVLEISRGEVICKSTTHLGEFSEPLSADYDGADALIALNPNYIIDAIDALDSKGLRICLAGESPVIFRPIDTDDTLCAIAAMRGE